MEQAINVAGLVEQVRPVTVQQFFGNELRPLNDLAGFSFTLIPDLMRPDLWAWQGAPEVAMLVAASACWDDRRLRTPS